MTHLDTRLREILLSDLFMDGLPPEVHQVPLTKAHTDWANKMVAQIHQAFEDDGYVRPVDMPHGVYNYNNAGFTMIAAEQAMTGQEWYDRFVKELQPFDGVHIGTSNDMNKVCLTAAKRAAGLDK